MGVRAGDVPSIPWARPLKVLSQRVCRSTSIVTVGSRMTTRAVTSSPPESNLVSFGCLVPEARRHFGPAEHAGYGHYRHLRSFHVILAIDDIRRIPGREFLQRPCLAERACDALGGVARAATTQWNQNVSVCRRDQLSKLIDAGNRCLMPAFVVAAHLKRPECVCYPVYCLSLGSIRSA